MTILPHPATPPAALPTQPPGVAWPTDGWPVDEGHPARDEIDDLLDEAVGAGSGEALDATLAVVVVQGGRLVAERYGSTAGPDEELISWSMAKSITHALVGILVGDGRLDPAAPAPVPEWADPADPRAAITIDHLLCMVSGLRFNEDYVDAEASHCIEMLFGEGRSDMAAYTASQPAVGPPGTVFNYSSGTTNILCRILADAVGSGEAFERWMTAALLDPLGISARLTFDDAGTWVGSSFLHTTARDYAKFGLLYLRDGVWDGERLLPERWVDAARTPQATDDDGGVYGAHWWIWPHDDTVFHASGYETQRIVVDPGNDLVLVRLGKTPTEAAPAVDAWLERLRRCVAEA